MPNLASNVVNSAQRHPERIAVKLDDDALTYADLDDRSARVAGWLLEQGLEPGDRVGLMLPNELAYPVLYNGILRAGGTVVPMNPLLKSREVQHYLRDSGASRMFVWQDLESEAAAAAAEIGAGTVVTPIGRASLAEIGSWPLSDTVADRAADDTAVLLYTSGTTGTPKGAELTHANLLANAEATRGLLTGDGGASDHEVIMGCLPLFHAFGQTCGMNTAILMGATFTMIARFDPVTVLKVIERDRVTLFQGVPTMYVALLAAGPDVADTSSLRLCSSGGAALPAEVLRSFAQTFGAEILEGYGLSETSPVASFNHVGDTRANSIGKPIAGVEMRVVTEAGDEAPVGEPGEIAVKGHNIMKGYWNRPDATADAIRDGWFLTGDIGKKDEDGFFYVVDRKKELIIRGGFNVYPREIEEVLYEHPAVLEAAVVGVPHDVHGEEIAAAVALRPGKSAAADELRAYVKERVAPYKYPRHVWIFDSLPKGATGKIQKRDIQIPAEEA